MSMKATGLQPLLHLRGRRTANDTELRLGQSSSGISDRLIPACRWSTCLTAVFTRTRNRRPLGQYPSKVCSDVAADGTPWRGHLGAEIGR